MDINLDASLVLAQLLEFCLTYRYIPGFPDDRRKEQQPSRNPSAPVGRHEGYRQKRQDVENSYHY